MQIPETRLNKAKQSLESAFVPPVEWGGPTKEQLSIYHAEKRTMNNKLNFLDLIWKIGQLHFCFLFIGEWRWWAKGW